VVDPVHNVLHANQLTYGYLPAETRYSYCMCMHACLPSLFDSSYLIEIVTAKEFDCAGTAKLGGQSTVKVAI